MKHMRRTLALVCAFFILLSAQPFALAEEPYSVSVTAGTEGVEAGTEITVPVNSTVTLTATVKKGETAVTDLKNEGVQLWFWADKWESDHGDGLGADEGDNKLKPADNSGNVLTTTVTLPEVGNYYIAASLEDGDKQTVGKGWVTIHTTDGSAPAPETPEGYVVTIDKETVSAKTGDTVSLAATITNDGKSVTLGDDAKLWWWADSWNSHADGNNDASLSGHDPDNGLSNHVDVTVPSAGKYYIAAELQDKDKNRLAISYCTITVEEGEKAPVDIPIPNGDFENGEDNWSITGEHEIKVDTYATNNKTNTLAIKDTNTTFSAAYNVTLTAGTYYFTYKTAGLENSNGGFTASVTSGGETLVEAADAANSTGWDSWTDGKTGEFTLEEQAEVTFLYASENINSYWGNLDDLELHGTGAVVETAPDKVEADIYVPYVKGTGGDDFFRGADVSSLLSILNSGAKFKDWEGNSLGETVDEQGKAFMELLAESGVNWIRLRVWNDPYTADKEGYGGGNNDVEAAKTMGKWATDAGLRVLIDFHYSDFWADPGKQKAPKAWANLSVDEKAEAIKDFTTQSLNTLLEAGVDVGMVQVGNETTNKICDVSDWADKAKLFDAGCDAVHAVGEAKNHPILAAIHFTNPERSGNYANFAKNLSDNNVSYDVFASSYYPYWHGTLENLTTVLKQVADTYGKKVIVAETSWAWTLDDGDGWDNTVRQGNNDSATYPFTVQGQAIEFASVAQAVRNVGVNGVGVFYWENAWIPVVNVSEMEGDARETQIEKNKALWEEYGSGWASSYASEYDPDDAGIWYGGSAVDNQAMFDFDGKPLESLNVFKYMTTGTTGYENTIVSTEDVTVNITAGDQFSAELMPKTVTVTYLDGAKAELEVTWNETDLKTVNPNKAGTYSVRGTVTDEDGQSLEFTAKVVVALNLTGENLLQNPGVEEEDITMFHPSQAYVKRTTEDPHSGKYGLHFYSSGTVSFTAYQEVTLEPGHYAFTLFGQGGNMGDSPEAYIYVKYGDTELTADVSLTGWNIWDSPIIEFTVTEATTVQAGVSITAAAGAWGTFDDWYLGTVEETECAHPEGAVEHVEAKAATYDEEGNIEYWHCKDCDKYFKDEALTQEITLADTVIAKRTRPSGSGSVYTPPTTTEPTDSGVASSGSETVATPETSSGSVTVPVDMGNEIVKQVKDNNSDTAVVAPEFPSGTTKADVTVPAKTVRELGDTDADLRIETPAADVTIPNAALAGLAEAGNVTVSTDKSGETVTVSVTAGGKAVDTAVKAALALSGGDVAVLVIDDGTETIIPKSVVENGVTYVLIDGSATIKVVENSKTFTDVKSTDWFAGYVDFVTSHTIFDGTGESTFAPKDTMNRAMLATVIWKLEGRATAENGMTFSDVAAGKWYSEGIAWASANGVVQGSDGKFDPERAVTRQEMAVMIYNYAKGLGLDTSKTAGIDGFADASEVSTWAKDAMSWAYANGIITGTGSGLNPAGTASRSEVAAVLQRLVTLIVK